LKSIYRKPQKQRELFFFSRFRKCCSLVPGGRPIQPAWPEPDVIVEGTDLGVEITEFYREEKRKRDESEQELLLAEAQRLYVADDRPPLIVSVFWNDGASTRRKDRSTLAQTLVAAVVKNMPPVDSWLEIEQDGEPSCPLPAAIDSLKIERFSFDMTNNWSSPRAAFVHGCSADEIQAIISKKNSRFLNYDGLCKRLWLLIAIEGTAPSSWCELPAETRSHEYVSVFEHVFLMERTPSRVIKLPVTQMD
jgi:hypothetical protein